MSHARTNHAPRAFLLLAAPTLLASCVGTVDPLAGATIADLTTAEAEQWCSTTYEGMWPPNPPVLDRPIQPDGTVNGAEYGGAFGADHLCVLHLPIDQCAKNLKLFPCQATLQELDDAIQATFPVDHESPNWDAVVAFHAKPSCDKTIVTAFPGSTPRACTLPVK